MTEQITYNQNNDLCIVCARCGCSFSCKGNYSKQLSDIFNNHPCFYTKTETHISIDPKAKKYYG